MKQTVSKFSTLIVSIFILSCASSGERLKKLNPNMYNEIIGTWYVLSYDKPFEISYTISFNHDGTVTGDVSDVFGYSNARWLEKVYIGTNTLGADADGYQIRPGALSVYRSNTDNVGTADQVFYTDNKNEINLKDINQVYLNFIPPLQIMIIESQMAGVPNVKFIFARDQNDIKEIKAKYSNKMLNDNDNWNKLNKNSVIEHITFLKSTYDDSLKQIAEASLQKLLDQKVIKYIQKEFKQYSKYSNSLIVFENGMEVCKLYEFLKLIILSKNNISGEKSTVEIVKNTDYQNGFDVTINFNNDAITFTFKPYKNNLVIMGLSKGYSMNPNGWEYAVKIAAEAFNVYPELDYIDIDLLEKL